MMSTLATLPPARRPELVLGPPGENGGIVVKDPRSGSFYNLGPYEAFLLRQLDQVEVRDIAHLPHGQLILFPLFPLLFLCFLGLLPGFFELCIFGFQRLV